MFENYKECIPIERVSGKHHSGKKFIRESFFFYNLKVVKDNNNSNNFDREFVAKNYSHERLS